MKHENAHQYVDYIDGDGIQALYSGVNKYVTHKQYDTSYGDIVPFIMSNAICINFMIIIQLADSYRVQLVECVENNRPTIILLKSGEHYDAITPNVHNTPIYSALPVNRTENDIQLTEMREMNDQGRIQNNCDDVLEVIQTPGSNVFNANIDTDDILPLSNTNLNWIKSNCNTHRYRYFNIYPGLYNSPLVINKVNVCRRPMLNMGHLNIRSVPQHYNELLLLPLHQFDILCFSETWLNSNHSDQSIELTFFADPFRHDRLDVNKSRGGGCALYYKLGLDCTQLASLENIFYDEIDSVWVKLKTQNKPLIIGTIYKPPRANNTRFISSLEEIFLHPTINQYDIILMGDYNINWRARTSDQIKFENLLANFSIKQVINGVTHVGLANESCIDLVCKFNNIIAHSCGIIFNPMHNGITWHNFTYISLHNSPNRAPRKIINKRNFKHIDMQMFVDDAMVMFDDNCNHDGDSVDILTNLLESKITALVDKHAPFKRVRVRPTRKPWITNTLLKQITYKNRLFKSSRNNASKWPFYKEYRNNLLFNIQETKQRYYRKLITDSKPHEKWDVMNIIADKRKNSKDIQELVNDGQIVTQPTDIANVLNMFFSSIGFKINNDLKKTVTTDNCAWFLNPNGFKLQHVTCANVLMTLNNLSNNKKGRVTQIPTFIYKWLSFIIINPLTTIINKVISTSTFPHIWKEALVTPLPKPGDPCNPSSYRPISSLPILSKVAEKVIAHQIRAYLELNYLISCNQFGFRERHSNQSLLLQLTNKWLTTLDSIIGENTYA